MALGHIVVLADYITTKGIFKYKFASHQQLYVQN